MKLRKERAIKMKKEFIILSIFILSFAPCYVFAIETSNTSAADAVSPISLSVRNSPATPSKDVASECIVEATDNAGGTSANGQPMSASENRSYILNTVGSTQYSSLYWKPHSFGLKNAGWRISFGDKVTMFLDNKASEFGHIACGSWWVPNFLHGKKLPLKKVKSLVVSVDVYLSSVNYNAAHAILRMAVASAISVSGAPKFTELDFWDSPAACTLLYPDGNKFYNGNDEYSYKKDQVQAGQWITLTNDYMPYIKASWGDLSQASLECIYIVIESDCRKHQSEDTVSLDVRNLIIRVTE